MEVTHYMLRTLMISEDVDNTVLAWIKKAAGAGGHCVIKHNADKEDASPHWHAWFTSVKKLQALRVDFKKANEKHVGNGSYSLKESKDPEAYLRYMCHADGDGCEVEVVSAHGVEFTPQWFIEQNRLFYEKQRKVKKERKEKKLDLYHATLKECQETNITSRERILKRYMLIAKDMGIERLDVYNTRARINAIWIHVGGPEAEQAFMDEVLSRI